MCLENFFIWKKHLCCKISVIRSKLNASVMTYQDFQLVCSDMGWYTLLSVWTRTDTRTPLGVWARDGTAGQASATRGSRWREAGLSCETPAAAHLATGGWSHICWAVRGCWGPSPSPPWHPFSSSASSPGRPQPSPPIFPPHRPASSPAIASPLGWWRRTDWTWRS